jgi:3-oxo-5,6-didehydrosuberyl-CoA/3-oxoadipyl-CoA thiolase
MANHCREPRREYGISRTQVDEYALLSQTRAKAALDQGFFKVEIAPYSSTDKKGNTTTVTQDEHPKPSTTIETLTKLKAVSRRTGL